MDLQERESNNLESLSYQKEVKEKFICQCGKVYNSYVGRWLHRKKKGCHEGSKQKSFQNIKPIKQKKIPAKNPIKPKPPIQQLKKQIVHPQKTSDMLSMSFGNATIATEQFCNILMEQDMSKQNLLQQLESVCQGEVLSDFYFMFKDKKMANKHYNDNLGLYQQTIICVLSQFLMEVTKKIKLRFYSYLAFIFLDIIHNGIMEKNNIKSASEVFEQKIVNIGKYFDYVFQNSLKRYRVKYPLIHLKMLEDKNYKRMMDMFSLWLFLKKYCQLQIANA